MPFSPDPFSSPGSVEPAAQPKADGSGPARGTGSIDAMTDAQFQAFVDGLPDDLEGFNSALAGLSAADQAAFHARIMADAQGGSVDYDSYAGVLLRGFGQGVLNLVNGLQDTGIGIANLPAMGVNGIAWAEEKLGILPENSLRVPYIPSPEWAKDWIVPNDPLHGLSKALAPLAIEGWLSGKIVKFVKPLFTNVDDAARAIDANKLNHIFRPAHNLDDLIRASGGSTEEAYKAVQQAANQAMKNGLLKAGPNGVLAGAGNGIILKVNGVNIQLVGGRIIDGVVHLGSFIGI